MNMKHHPTTFKIELTGNAAAAIDYDWTAEL
jgi:hypothetical protein